MPNLAQLTDAYEQPDNTFPVEQPFVGNKEAAISIRPVTDIVPPAAVADTRPEPRPEPGIFDNLGMAGVEDKSGKSESKIIKKLFGLGGEERYQLWPEKVVREGLSGAGDVLSTGALPQGLRREDFTDIPAPSMPTNDSTWLGRLLNVAPVAAQPADALIEKAQAISALAGTGGLAGTTDATLGATPFLRPALKYEGKIYKGQEGQQHLDVLPKHLADTFHKQALSGDDISNFQFGFVNEKGHFLDREKALQHAIDTGLIDPHAAQYGALTSTLMADSSKPGMAIEALAKNGQDAFHGTAKFDPAKVGQNGLLLSDSSVPGVGIAAMAKTKAPAFYSAVEHQVNQINQSKMTGEAWLGTLANKPGVKPEELQWTGLKDFLEENKGKPITKEQIQEHLANNKVELKEVNKGGDIKPTEKDYRLAREYVSEANPRVDPNSQRYNELVEEQARALGEQKSDTKYHSYQLPGGENYREMLLTLPEKSNTRPQLDAINKRMNEISNLPAREHTPEITKEWDTLNAQRKALIYDEAGNVRDAVHPYKSSHWDEPNILAHVRMNDRTMSEPGYRITNLKSGNTSKTFPTYEEALTYANSLPDSLKPHIQINEGVSPKKSLHLEEIQSDWHQQGRDRGYGHPAQDEFEKVKSELLKKYKVDTLIPLQGKLDKSPELISDLKRLDIANQAWQVEKHQGMPVPDAPFKKTWHELALKRMIREAAEKGYDRLSWTPGEAQAARYDLSKQVDEVRLVPKNKNTDPAYEYRIDAFKNGERVTTKPANNEKEVADIVGKEVAKKLFEENKDNKGSSLKGQQLSIGGEGMKGFYDQIIPKALEKISGQKVKHGVVNDKFILKNKYGHEARGGITQAEAEKALADPIHYIDIPQSLKDTAMHKGFPLFSGNYMYTPVAGNPFDTKEKK